MVATTHDENTMFKVREALMMALGGSPNLVDDCLTELQNNGILFRERASDGSVGEEGRILEPSDQKEESNLVKHARRELELVGEDQDVIAWYCRVVQEFASFGHSGGSHAATLPVLTELLQFHNLTPLTNDPGEWVKHGGDIWPPDGIWQNSRNSEAFSEDGGKTYYLLNEVGDDKVKKFHTAKEKI